MALFTDTITLFNKIASSTSYSAVKVDNVQWSERTIKSNSQGKLRVDRYIEVTFPEGTYEGLVLDASRSEDAIFLGDMTSLNITDVKGNRMSDKLKEYAASGTIQTVNDNSLRTRLKNKKVILG